MDNNNLDQLMADYDQKLESGRGNEITPRSKSVNPKNRMRYFFLRTCFELLTGMITIEVLGSLLLNSHDSPSVVVSSALVIVFAGAIVIGAIRQIPLILKFDWNRDLITNQKILTQLQTRFLFWLKIALLQIPFFPAYIILGFALIFNVDIWKHGEITWLYSNIILGAVLVPPVVWLFAKLTPANIQVPWVRRVVSMFGGDHLVQSMEYLEELESFRTE